MANLNTNQNRDQVIGDFPLLSNDPNFIITSKQTPDYNCIAWAADVSNMWYQPIDNPPIILDGVRFDWPYKLPNDRSLNTYKRLFEHKHYEVCPNFTFDVKFKKIALYIDPVTTLCTHAARQLRNGHWTCKLGAEFDIQHSDPTLIVGGPYGIIGCYMQQVF